METGTNLLDDTDLDVLNSLTNLQMLSIGGLDSVTSLSYLSNLTSLTQLWMGSNPISDWTPLGAVASNLNAFFVANCGLGQTELENYVADMTSIQYVDESNIGMLGILIEPGITDLSSLDQLNPSIAFLALLGITNIDFAQNWTNLYIFICFGMGITNINGLIGLQNLTLAVLGSNNIGPTMFTEGVTPAALNSLTGISLAENKLESISGIEYMPNLNSFDASNNLITDISSLSNSPNTGTLESLMLSNNQIEEINSLKECIELDIVHLDHNQIQDFTPLVENEGIGNGDYIDISYNPVPPELCDVVDQLVAKVQPDGGVNRNGVCDITVIVEIEGTGNTSPPAGESHILIGSPLGISAYPQANSGQAFDHWEIWDEGTSSYIFLTDSSGYNFSDVQQDIKVKAVFVPGTYNLTFNIDPTSTGTGTVWPLDGGPGVYSYKENQIVHLSANPSPGSAFAGWTGDIGSVDPMSPGLSIVMNSDKVITAKFSEPDYIVLLSIEGPGTIVPSPGTYYFVSGQWMNLNAMPGPGKAFLGWYEGESLLSKDLSYGLQVTADHIIVARFGEPDYIVTLSVEGPGTINPAPGEYYFSEGQQMVLFATPDPGKVFLGWYEGEMLLSDHPIYGFGVMANRNIVARFGEPDYIVTLSVDGPGTINPAPGEYYFSEGQQMALFATPDPGKAFLGWYEGGELLSKNTYYNLEVTANHNIVARFGDANYTVTLSVEGPGTINPAPGEYYFSEGQLMYLFATPDPGKAFLGWYEGEMLLSDYPIYGFEVTANRNIVARFSEPDFTITLVISGNGTTNPIPGTYGYKAGGNAGFFATPDSGYAFLHWEINDGVDIRYEINTSLSLQVQANLTVTAVFSNQDECTWNVNTSLAGTGIGWISPSPSNYCFMTEQELAISTGTIENNYFGGIQLVKDPLGTPEESWVYWFFHKLNVDADYNVTAHFENTGWMFRLNIEGYGLVFASDGETMIYPSSHALANNFPLKLTAVANIEEMPFRGWYSNGVRISTEPVFETTLNSDLQLTARFAPYAWYQLVISLVEGEGTTNPAPGGYSYIEGSTVEVKAIPDAGWAFSNWVGDIDGIENIDQPIINVPIDKTRYIGVIFVELPPEGEGTTEGTIEGTTEGTVEGAVEGEIGPHSADRDGDGVISLSELLRVIQFFNMGGYHCDPSNEEDGYAGGIEGDHSCTPHASDYDEQDWTIDLGELLRLIQFFNIGGYHPCPGIGEDDYCPGLVG